MKRHLTSLKTYIHYVHSDAQKTRARFKGVSEIVVNRVTKGFIISPLILALTMSLINVSFGDLEFSVGGVFFGFILYSLIAYFLTITLAVPSYFIVKKISNKKPISYFVTSFIGCVLGGTVSIFLMSGFEHVLSIVMFSFLGFCLSNVFWYVALK